MKHLFKLLPILILLAATAPALALEEPPQVHFVVLAFELSGDNPLSDEQTQEILQPYKGDHYGLTGLQDAVVKLEKAFATNGYAFHRAILIPQELENGIIKFQITVLRLNSVDISGNQHFDETNLMRNLPSLRADEVVNTRELSRALNMANSHPAKDLKLKFAENKAGGGIDAKLTVVDQKPNYFFTALNNTGTDETGEFRLTAGYQFSNLFNRDHTFALSYTTSPDDTSAVSQYGAFYSIPLYDSGTRLSAFYTRSDVDSGIIQQAFTVAGKGAVTALRYNKTLLQVGAYKQEIELGLDHKKFENDSSFSGVSIGSDVVSSPVSFFYKGAVQSTASNFSFNIGMAKNISGGSLNEDADYINNGATTADWSAVRYGGEYSQFFAGQWLFRLRWSGQETSDELIAGEQFGVGGMNSVRGFDERIILGDTGYQMNFELWFPAVSRYEIRSLMFYDLGHVETINPDPGVLAEEDPASAGVGLRWAWQKRFSAALDLAYVTDAAGIVKKGDNRAHLDIFYRF